MNINELESLDFGRLLSGYKLEFERDDGEGVNRKLLMILDDISYLAKRDTENEGNSLVNFLLITLMNYAKWALNHKAEISIIEKIREEMEELEDFKSELKELESAIDAREKEISKFEDLNYVNDSLKEEIASLRLEISDLNIENEHFKELFKKNKKGDAATEKKKKSSMRRKQKIKIEIQGMPDVFSSKRNFDEEDVNDFKYPEIRFRNGRIKELDFEKRAILRQ